MSVAERYIEAVNNADTPALLALFAEDATLTVTGITETGGGIPGAAALIDQL